MGKLNLIYSVFSSETRKDILLLLDNGPQERQAIQNILDVSVQALVSHIKILEENHLITRSEDVYRLTSMGRAIVNEIIPTLDMMHFFENSIEYWGNHNFDFIPPHLLRRINDLGLCAQVSVPFCDFYTQDVYYLRKVTDTKRISLIKKVLLPDFKELFIGLLGNDTEISIIVPKEFYEILQSKHREDLEFLLQIPRIQFHVYPKELNLLSLIVTDHETVLRLLTLDGGYDSQRIICSSNKALQWSKDLFEHYLKESMPVTKIDMI